MTKEKILYLKGREVDSFKSEERVNINKLSSNFWYDDYEISYRQGNKESRKVPIPSFKTKHRREVIIDIARRYLSLDSIKQIIDTIHDNGGENLQLYISDNDRFGIYSDYLGQTNTEPNNNYLTKNEVQELVSYANERGILVVPNIDVPSHSGKWLSIVREKYPEKVITSDFDDTLVDYWWNEESYEAVKNLIGEYFDVFRQPNLNRNLSFHIGGDESPGAEGNQPAFIDFINNIATFIFENGYKPMIWNDCIYESGLGMLNRGIDIYYWQKQGNSLSAKDFANDNRDLVNCNFYATTFLPAPKFESSDIDWQVNYINDKFNTDTFCEGTDDTNIFSDVGKPLSVRGTSMVFWSENSLELTEERYLAQVKPLIETYLNVSQS